jgi:rod shape determining protein RodA
MNLNRTKKESSDSILYKLYGLVKPYDHLQTASMVVLLITGLSFIYSTGQQVGGPTADIFWQRQLQWLGLGICVWLFMSIFDYRMLKFFSPFIYICCIILLIAVLIWGTRVYGAQRWLVFRAGGRIRLQPSEFAKLGTIIFLAMILSWQKFRVNNIFYLLLVGVITLIPFMLIVVEPDLGSAMILLPILAGMIFVAGIKWKYIIIVMTCATIFIAAEILNEVYEVKPLLRGYQKERILVFLNPERDLNNRGYNQFQARLAVGSGGLRGKGFGKGTQNTLGFLPQSVSNNDFIFSVIAEETGFIGATALILTYILLLYTMLRTAWLATEPFGRYLAVGIAVVFFVHSFINIGMSLGIMPITGLPLPQVSYGGSFLIFTMLCLGILQSIYINSRRTE